METLRFLMVTTHFPPQHLGGDAVFVEYLSKELVKKGHEVHVFHNPASYDLVRSARQPSKEVETVTGLFRHPYHSRLGRVNPIIALTIGRWGGAEKRLLELSREMKPDVVHWHNTRGFIGRPFALQNAVCLYTAHDYTTVCPRSTLLRPNMAVCDVPRLCTICHLKWGKPPQLWRAGKNRRVILPPIDVTVLSLSDFVANRLRQDGIQVSRILRGFVPDLGEKETRNRSTPGSIVYLGLLEPHKGVHTLLEAFERTRDQQGFKLHLIGEGSSKADLIREVERLHLTDRVVVPGFLAREDVEEIRRSAYVQVVPSIWYENAPSTVLEAYSLGLPVLASKIGGLPEIVGPEAGSSIFEAGDVDELARQIVSTWNTRESFGERSKMARRVYENKFKPEIHVAEYLNLINDLFRLRDAKSRES